MWIRSQSKKAMGDFSSFEVGSGFSVVGYLDSTNRAILGEYETKERAMEVLGMIEDRIMNGTKFDEIYNGRRTTRDFVFQMPQE